MGVWQPFRGPFERWPQLTDVSIAIVALVLTLAMWSQRSSPPTMDTFMDVGAYLVAFVACLALLWRRSHPWQVHAVVMAATILIVFMPTADGVVAMAFSLYSLGRYEADSRTSLTGAGATFVFLVLDQGLLMTPSADGAMATVMAIALWYVGRRLRFRGEYLRLLEERAAHLEREQSVEAERAVAAERTRIAREMHDVVAHKLSLMTVQAGAARTISASDPKAASDAMSAVESAGRHAMSEMRHLLGVLRPADAGDALGPQPCISDLPALVREVNEVGPTVHLATSGSLSGLPSSLELTVYRIAQEALTNVIKHAGEGVRSDVSVDGRDDRVVVTITDNGHGSGAGKKGGHGIAGMRERVELLGGSFRAADRPDGGFEVCAVLPIDREVH